jgi:hypothetical protein
MSAPPFTRRTVTIAPRAARAYDAAEWGGALVLVAHGRIELVGEGGTRRGFRTGAVLALDALALRAVVNPSAVQPAVLVTIERASTP